MGIGPGYARVMGADGGGMRRVVRRVRDKAWRVVLGGGGTGGAWSSVAHYPGTHRPSVPGYVLPEALDRSVPWVGSLAGLYEMAECRPASVSPEAGMLLHSLVRSVSPRVVVETGTYLTVSTHWIGAALGPSAVLHSFDTFGSPELSSASLLRRFGVESHEALARALVERAGLGDVVRLHRGKSAEEIGRIAETGGLDRVQLVFLDGDHSVRGVLRDFLAVEPLLETGGYVVLHDVYPDRCGHEGPRALLDRLLASGRYQGCGLYTSPQNFGMAVLQRLA